MISHQHGPQTHSFTLSFLYLGTAHVALALACALAMLWPQAIAGFFYHSWSVALVHLVTLGWITFSIFGGFFIVGPLALRTNIRATRADYVAYGVAVLGLIGLVGHFWIEEYSGMAWSAGTIAASALYTTARIALNVRRAPIPAAARLHIILACANLWAAATMGLLLGIDKVAQFLPGYILSNVFAHAHMAAIGWATMMVAGVGYRLLPMVLPSKMPSGPSLYASACLLEGGVCGLFIALLTQSRRPVVFGVVVVAGLVTFLGHVLWMLRHRVARPAAAPRFDFAVAHAALAGACLVTAMVLGLFLQVAPMSTTWLHTAAAYGVLGLIGFLAQIVVAMETRLLPMAAWYRTFTGSGHAVVPTSPHRMRDRSLQAIVLGGWLLGVPALAGGMARESAQLVGLGGAALFVAVSVAAVDHVFVVLGAGHPASTEPMAAPSDRGDEEQRGHGGHADQRPSDSFESGG